MAVWFWGIQGLLPGGGRRLLAGVFRFLDQDWGMREFTMHDPSGVLWRIAENIS